MNEQDLTPCAICGEGLAAKAPVFYRIVFAQHVVDVAAVQRRMGLRAIMGGNDQLARVFSPDSQFDREMFSNQYLICQECVLEKDTPLHRLFPSE